MHYTYMQLYSYNYTYLHLHVFSCICTHQQVNKAKMRHTCIYMLL